MKEMHLYKTHEKTKLNKLNKIKHTVYTDKLNTYKN